MRFARYTFLAVVGPLAISAAASGAPAATIVKIELQDPSTGPEVKGMQVKSDRTSVPAGPVTFQVANESKSLVHEMIVIKDSASPSALPYEQKKDEVDEDRIRSLGEVSELRPGKSGALTIDMDPGTYLLFCN